jgi:hypothetical protein
MIKYLCPIIVDMGQCSPLDGDISRSKVKTSHLTSTNFNQSPQYLIYTNKISYIPKKHRVKVKKYLESLDTYYLHYHFPKEQ